MRRTKDKALLQLITLSCLMSGMAPALAADTSEPYVIKESDLIKKENSLTQNPLMQEVKASIRTLDNDSVDKIAPRPQR